MKQITIATDYTRFPVLRFKRLGPGSGEGFREKILLPALRENGKVVVNLDGTRGYGSSFLEEAFGGTVREGVKLTSENLELKSEDKWLIEEVWEYIEKASS